MSFASGACSADTNGTTDTLVDITGASVSLGAGTWVVWASASIQTTTQTYVLVTIADGSNTDYSCGKNTAAVVSATQNVEVAPPPVIVTPASTTTYKLRFQTGLNGTNAIAKKQADNSGQVLTRIVALQIAQ